MGLVVLRRVGNVSRGRLTSVASATLSRMCSFLLTGISRESAWSTGKGSDPPSSIVEIATQCMSLFWRGDVARTNAAEVENVALFKVQ